MATMYELDEATRATIADARENLAAVVALLGTLLPDEQRESMSD